jgi:glycosyltransferase involved in cell wall biosynthesis
MGKPAKQQKLHVLFLTHFYPPEMGAAAARLHGLARWLAKWGHDVTTLTGFPNYPSGTVPKEYCCKFQTCEEKDGVKVIRTWVFATSHRSSVRRLLNYLSFVVSSIITGITLRRSFDVVLISSPPLFIGVAGSILSTVFRVPFVLDLRDLWPDVAIQAGVFTENSFPVKWSRFLANFIYRSAAHLTPVTESKLERLKAIGVEKAKLTVVTNGVDFDRLDLSKYHDWREELDISAKFVIMYTGLIGVAQGIGIAVEAAELLKHNSDIHFVIVGEGVERDDLIERVKLLQLENITFVPRQPREAIPSLIAVSDVALVPLVSSALRDAVPSKLLEAWACRKAVILVAGGEAAELVRKSSGGVVVKPGSPKELARTITELSQDRNLLNQYAEAGHLFVKERYDRRRSALIMENVLARVVKERM